jgi:hypothetical protein
LAPRGRPRGTTTAFSSDPDRYVIALTDAIMLTNPDTKFEHAVMLSIYFHWRERIALPADPLRSLRRLALSPTVQERLLQGWQMQQWGPQRKPNDVIGGQVDRIRKKMARIAGDPAATRWRYYMRLAWSSILSSPSVAVVEAATREAGEGAYFRSVMLPFTSAI